MNAAALLFGSNPVAASGASSKTESVTRNDNFQQIFQTAWQEQKPVPETAPPPELADALVPPETLTNESSESVSTSPPLQNEAPVANSVPNSETGPKGSPQAGKEASPSEGLDSAPASTSLSMTDLTAELFKTTLQSSSTTHSTSTAEKTDKTIEKPLKEAPEKVSKNTVEELLEETLEKVVTSANTEKAEEVTLSLSVAHQVFTASAEEQAAANGAPFVHFQNQRSDFFSLTQGSGFQFPTEASVATLQNPVALLPSLLGVDQSPQLASDQVTQPTQLPIQTPTQASTQSQAFSTLLGQASQTLQTPLDFSSAFSTPFVTTLPSSSPLPSAVPGSSAALLSEAAAQLETRFEIFKQLEQQMYLLRHHQQREIQIQLEPAQLGKLNLRLQQEGHLFQLHITAESAVAKEILDAHIQQLRQQFAQQGFELKNVEVNVHSDTSGGFDSENFQESQGATDFLSARAMAMPFSLLSGVADEEGSPLLTYASAAPTYYYHQVNYFA